MLRKICSGIYLLVGILIGLGTFGHLSQVRHVYAALNNLPILHDMIGTIYVIWYFVSGSMAVFGLTIVWTWFRLKKGETNLLFVSKAISGLYFVSGISGLIIKHGEPFWTLFIVESILLFFSAHILRKDSAYSNV